MRNVIIGIIAIVLVGAVGYYLLQKGHTTPAPQPVNTTQQQPTTNTYATSTFSVTYPLNYTLDENYAYIQVSATKPIHGVKFTIPGTMATGTNLSADSYVSVEQLPNARKCTGDIYIRDNVKSTSLTEGNTTYSVASTSGAGAGNFYEETVYAVANSAPCTAVRYFIHSTNIGNYPAGAVHEFDRAALLAQFDQIRNSLHLTGGASPAPTGTTTRP